MCKLICWFSYLLCSKKSCYGPLLAHFMDKATDVAVVYQFWKLGTKELRLKTDSFDLCEHMNVFYLFLLSIGVLLLYHLACCFCFFAILQYPCTKSLVLLVFFSLQFLNQFCFFLRNRAIPNDGYNLWKQHLNQHHKH